MKTNELVSQLVANRSEFFALLDRLEKAVGMEVDVTQLEACIDAEYDNRASVTEREATKIIDAASAAPIVV